VMWIADNFGSTFGKVLINEAYSVLQLICVLQIAINPINFTLLSNVQNVICALKLKFI
jgi:hypothetical protein